MCDCCDCCGDEDGWTPAELPASQLSYWFKADAGVTLGTGVSAWADQSGNGNHVSQAIGANQPLYVANYRNGLPGLFFDGANDSLFRTVLTQGSIAIPYRRYSVYSPQNVVSSPMIASNYADNFSFDYVSSGDRYQQRVSSISLIVPTVVPNNSVNIGSSLVNGALVSRSRNIRGGVPISDIVGTSGVQAQNGLRIGARGVVADFPFQGHIVETLSLRAASATDTVIDGLIIAYLQNKWNIYP